MVVLLVWKFLNGHKSSGSLALKKCLCVSLIVLGTSNKVLLSSVDRDIVRRGSVGCYTHVLRMRAPLTVVLEKPKKCGGVCMAFDSFVP